MPYIAQGLHHGHFYTVTITMVDIYRAYLLFIEHLDVCMKTLEYNE